MNDLRIVIDMNLSIEWIDEFSQWGIDAVHWSTIGSAKADDTEIMAWARLDRRIVFTHDLDFGTLLALTHADGPSVLQIRGHDVLPTDIASAIYSVIQNHGEALRTGALVVVDRSRQRVRVLPL